jgi:hypothetical protein
VSGRHFLWPLLALMTIGCASLCMTASAATTTDLRSSYGHDHLISFAQLESAAVSPIDSPAARVRSPTHAASGVRVAVLPIRLAAGNGWGQVLQSRIGVGVLAYRARGLFGLLRAAMSGGAFELLESAADRGVMDAEMFGDLAEGLSVGSVGVWGRLGSGLALSHGVGAFVSRVLFGRSRSAVSRVFDRL